MKGTKCIAIPKDTYEAAKIGVLRNDPVCDFKESCRGRVETYPSTSNYYDKGPDKLASALPVNWVACGSCRNSMFSFTVDKTRYYYHMESGKS